MLVPSSTVVETDALTPGTFAILHRYGLERGVPAIAARWENSEGLRLIPLMYPPTPGYAFAAMHESAIGGVALIPPGARLEVNFGSVVNSAAAYGETPSDALIGVGDKLLLPIREGYHTSGYLDLSTGSMSRGGLTSAWMAFAAWRVVDGNNADVPLFMSSGWEGDTDE